VLVFQRDAYSDQKHLFGAGRSSWFFRKQRHRVIAGTTSISPILILERCGIPTLAANISSCHFGIVAIAPMATNALMPWNISGARRSVLSSRLTDRDATLPKPVSDQTCRWGASSAPVLVIHDSSLMQPGVSLPEQEYPASLLLDDDLELLGTQKDRTLCVCPPGDVSRTDPADLLPTTTPRRLLSRAGPFIAVTRRIMAILPYRRDANGRAHGRFPTGDTTLSARPTMTAPPTSPPTPRVRPCAFARQGP